MNAPLVLDNLIAWSAQIMVLVTVGALAALTLKHPRARLIFWQGILAIAVLLPAIQPWTKPAPVAFSIVSRTTAEGKSESAAASGTALRWNPEYLLFLLAAGAFLRLLWIAAGLLRLRRHRLSAVTLAHPPVPFENAHVRWYLSETIPGPVTFGWIRPSILLPARVHHLPADLREAIACHELIHVRRRDWLFVLGEETIRACFWIHPAIWFVLGQIQLAREQVVDLEVVRLTCNRDRYLDALLAVAAHKFLPDVAPAPLFLKKRQLAVRVAAVLKETSMSKSRLVASLTAVCTAALIAARLAVWFFPLQSPAQTPPESRAAVVEDGPGVTVDAGAKLMHRPPVVYPRGARASGEVVVEASVNAKGEVTDARVLSGPDELRRAALQSVLQWHYSTDAGLPPTVRVSIGFDGPAPAPASRPAAGIVRARPEPITGALKSIQFMGVSPDVERKVRERLPVREGDQVSTANIAAVMDSAKDVDEHFMVNWAWTNATEGRREATLRFMLSPVSTTPPPARAANAAAAADAPIDSASGPPQRIRVGGNVQAANLVAKVTPAYPPLAKQARIQGVVRFNVIIDKEGVVQNLELVSGHPLLVPSATEAVRQWIYRPTLLNGQPVEVITQVDVNYTLTE